MRTYNLNLPATVDRPLFFGFDLGRHPPNSELLWDLFGANCAYEAVLSAGAFYFGTRATLGADWHFNETRIVVPLERWFVAGFEVSPTRNFTIRFRERSNAYRAVYEQRGSERIAEPWRT